MVEARPSWPRLAQARQQAAQRGARSIGTQHVLLALLSEADDDTVAALHAGGVDPVAAKGALNTIMGRGSRQEPVAAETVVISDRVERILQDAARYDPAFGECVRDRDVLQALLSSDDPAVGHLMVALLSDPQRVLDALDAPTGTQGADGHE